MCTGFSPPSLTLRGPPHALWKEKQGRLFASLCCVRIYVTLEPRLGDLREVPRKLTVSFLLSTLASFLNLSATTYFPKSSDRSSVHLVLGFCLPSVAETR